MSTLQIKKILSDLNSQAQRDLVIKINSRNIISNLEKSRSLIERMERALRIQKMELQVKRLQIQRSWV